MDLFPLLYFPPISYFIYWKQSLHVYVEACDNYQKQSFRNSMEILTSSGRLKLSIPILHSKHRFYKDSIINVHDSWKKNHWKTLYVSYRNSCYFEYYEEDIYRLIHQNTKYLFDFNQNILEWLIKIFNLSNYRLTEKFQHVIFGKDYRFFCSKNVLNIKNTVNSYNQVFSDRYYFESNLSILDFLFNVGIKI